MPSPFRIRVDDLAGSEVAALLREHLASVALHSPPESIHALSPDALRASDVTLWSVWRGPELVGCGALKELDAGHGELKSMRTASSHLRTGVATALLEHLLTVARNRTYRRVSLETGSMESFAPARTLYARFGFERCGPFADYVDDPNSVFMTRELGPQRGGRETMDDLSDAIFALVEYEVQCNVRLVEFLDRLPEADCRRDFGFGLRTPHRTVSHITDVLAAWSACVGPTIGSPVWRDYDEAETLGEIRRRMVDVGSFWLEAARASDEQGVLGKERRLHQVLHLVTHGTHHRGQVLSMMTLMGLDHPFEGGDFGGWSNVAAGSGGDKDRRES